MGVDVKLGRNVKLIQKTIISGKGTVIIGDDCSFGVNRGGYYYGGACEFQPRYKGARIIFGNHVSVNNNLFICSAGEVASDATAQIIKYGFEKLGFVKEGTLKKHTFIKGNFVDLNWKG